MSELYLIIVILLFVLAIVDLVVGVSNDAVNFLNSAIGSQVAPRHLIMLVASAGIFVGATFSSGMMEVARKGIFNPEFFFFGEIMIIFLSVMLTDIILLDFFNTLGLPTSTTVSIVFELLGAAVAMSLIKIASGGESISAIADYINSSQALLIISGIFLSIIFAFLIGMIVQFLSRLIFTFRYEQGSKVSSSLWSGIAMTAMTYFLLLKGIKGASFVSEALLTLVEEKMMLWLAGSFVIWTLIMHIVTLMGVNVFKVVVLFGTFALAMAFAGNDLVNFIGVPIAGFESYLAWSDSGQEAFSYSMEVLQQPVRTQSYLLVTAGLIMIVTLWFSRKARSVTDTEVNLGRQSEGDERFRPNWFARNIVQYSLSAGKVVEQILPSGWLQQAGKSFEPLEEDAAGKPAFDLVRAGVNLTTASILIAFATSLKLPLSTTYVSFMVAMGTSLADRAWGRDSAVYRVAGVLNVIGGWFATAIIAFTVAGLFVFVIFSFKLTAIILLILAAAFFIYRSFSFHEMKDKKKQKRIAFEKKSDQIAFEKLFQQLGSRISELLKILQTTYDSALKGLIDENPELLESASLSIDQLSEKNEDLQYELHKSIKRINESDSEGSRILLHVFDLEQDILQSAELIVNACDQHVQNVLSPLKPAQVVQLNEIRREVREFLSTVEQFLFQAEGQQPRLIQIRKKELLQKLEEAMARQIHGIKENKYGVRNSQLMFKILLETKDVVAVAARFVKLYRKVLDPQKQ